MEKFTSQTEKLIEDWPEGDASNFGPLISEDHRKKVFDAILSGKFKVDISKKYSLKDAAQAHKDLEARVLTGPAVIIP